MDMTFYVRAHAEPRKSVWCLLNLKVDKGGMVKGKRDGTV